MQKFPRIVKILLPFQSDRFYEHKNDGGLREKLAQVYCYDGFTDFEVDYDYVRGWFDNLTDLLEEDVPLARAQLGNLTEKIELTPVQRGNQQFLRAVGHANLNGLLQLRGNSSTRSNSGEGI